MTDSLIKLFGGLFRWVTNKNISISTKTATLVVTVFGIFLINDITGFTVHYRADKKMDQLERLGKIINNPNMDTQSKSYALIIRKEIMERKNVIDYTSYFLKSMFRYSANPKTIQTTPNENITFSKRQKFWLAASKGGVYILLSILSIPLIIFWGKKENTVIQRVGASIITGISLLIVGLFFIWVFGYFPIINYENLFWNYLINFSLQISILSYLIYIQLKKQKADY